MTQPPEDLHPATRPTISEEGPCDPDQTVLAPGVRLAHASGQGMPAACGRYQIASELARGGMGVVYKAFDPELRRMVALKLTQRTSPADDDELARRFLIEAQVTAQLQHPAVVPVHDVGRLADGQVFYTMRLVDGRTLGDVVLGRSADPGVEAEDWSLARLLEAFAQAARAVQYAHARGVVHRDLKPGNIMVGAFGEVYVLDWGISKVLADEPIGGAPAAPRVEATLQGGTLSGSVFGTPGFMAPEQACGEPVGPQADVYALGGILYFVLTESAPHDGTPTQILSRLARRVPPPSPRTLRPDLPEALAAICMRALAYDLEERTPSVRHLLYELQAYREGRTLNPADGDEAEFLRGYSASSFRKPSLTVDVVLATDTGERVSVLFLRRDQPPFAGSWALPGAFMELEETLEACARRMLGDKLSLPDAAEVVLERVGVYGEPSRDPRARVVTVAYLTRLPMAPALSRPPGGADLDWLEVDAEGVYDAQREPVGVAFDHGTIVRDAWERLQTRPR